MSLNYVRNIERTFIILLNYNNLPKMQEYILGEKSYICLFNTIHCIGHYCNWVFKAYVSDIDVVQTSLSSDVTTDNSILIN